MVFGKCSTKQEMECPGAVTKQEGECMWYLKYQKRKKNEHVTSRHQNRKKNGRVESAVSPLASLPLSVYKKRTKIHSRNKVLPWSTFNTRYLSGTHSELIRSYMRALWWPYAQLFQPTTCVHEDWRINWADLILLTSVAENRFRRLNIFQSIMFQSKHLSAPPGRLRG
jgi:hypothetical protein